MKVNPEPEAVMLHHHIDSKSQEIVRREYVLRNKYTIQKQIKIKQMDFQIDSNKIQKMRIKQSCLMIFRGLI